MEKNEIKELNQNYIKLYKREKKYKNSFGLLDEYESSDEDQAIKKELRRLYRLDNGFQYANKRSILIFMKLNSQLGGEIPYHRVGLKINLDKVTKLKINE